MVLQAFSNFFARSMHGQRGDIGTQADRQVPALAGFKRASLFFEPSFELGAGHVLRIQQICCLSTEMLSRLQSVATPPPLRVQPRHDALEREPAPFLKSPFAYAVVCTRRLRVAVGTQANYGVVGCIMLIPP